MPDRLLDGARAVIFDLGNTLVYPDWPRIRAVAEPIVGELPGAEALQPRMMSVLREADGDPDFLRRLDARAIPNHWHLRILLERLGSSAEAAERAVEALDRAHRERHLWSAPNPDSVPVLQRLRGAGLAVGVISNTEDGAADGIVRDAGLASYLDVCIDSFVVGFTKPDPRIFELALSRLGVAAEHALYVGDQFTQDVGGARGAGLRPVLFDPFDLRPEADAARIRSLRELDPGSPGTSGP